MTKITITEALSELNLIKKKVDKKRGNILGILVTAKHIKDPLESVGGAIAFIKSENQAIDDLNSRYIKLKGAIAKANIDNAITINGFTKNIHDWLIWKRDIAKLDISFYENVYKDVKQRMDQFAKQPSIYKDEKDVTHLIEPLSNVDQGWYLKKAEELTEVFEKLDGQLSLKNATIVVEA